MSKPSVPVALALALVVSQAAEAQGNALTLHNGGDVVFIPSAPSVGAPTGTFPPLITGDLFWKVIPGQALGAGPAVVEVDGLHEALFDTDWSTSPAFYDRTFDPVVVGALGNFEPAFFTTGTVGPFVSIGPSGFGAPCTVAPSICSPSTTGSVCAAPGFVAGWAVDVTFGATAGSGIPIPADNVSGTAQTLYLPGGMGGSGACGLGDFAIQDIHSTDETQADVLGSGLSPFDGSQSAGGGHGPDALANTYTGYVTIREDLVQIVADSGTGQGFEGTGGGALNGVNLDVGSGAAKVKALVSCAQCPPGLAFAAASLVPIAPPGLPLLGEALLISPTGPFQATLGIWQGPHVGATLLPEIPVPTTVAGTKLWIQGGVLEPGTFSLTLLTSFGLEAF